MGGGETNQQREYGENGNGEHTTVFTLEKKKYAIAVFTTYFVSNKDK